MSKNSSATKTAGKIFAAVTVIILIAVLAVTWFINGQTVAIEKYYNAVASGDLKTLKAISDEYRDYDDAQSDAFKQQQREYFESLPQFADLEKTDIISSQTEVVYHKLNNNIWECEVDVDYYCSGMSISERQHVSLRFDGGKWLIESVSE